MERVSTLQIVPRLARACGAGSRALRSPERRMPQTRCDAANYLHFSSNDRASASRFEYRVRAWGKRRPAGVLRSLKRSLIYEPRARQMRCFVARVCGLFSLSPDECDRSLFTPYPTMINVSIIEHSRNKMRRREKDTC